MHAFATSMKRRTIAAIWIAASTVPLLLATVFVFGCCVLPFHEIAHRLMPVCEMAASVMRGDPGGHEHQHDATPPPPREKQEPVKIAMPQVFRLAADTAAAPVPSQAGATGYRSFITLGAVRCDRDVGLHVLVETFLI